MKIQEVTCQKLSFPKWDIVYHQMPGDSEGNAAEEDPEGDDKPVPEKD